ncbi:CRE-SRI-12 protein [Aphelenchoides avenae]|nr:CRE-SRI-12 protein [Aphelenchus avenae]
MSDILNGYPSLKPVLDAHVCAPIPIWDHSALYIAGGVAVLDLGLIVGTASFLALRIFRVLHSRRHVMSARTYRMHKQLTVALVLQLLIPGFTLAVPFFLLIIFVLTQSNVAVAATIIMPIFGLHSVFNSVLLITAVGPYRATVVNAVRRVFRLRASKIDDISSYQLQSTANPEGGVSAVPRRTSVNTQSTMRTMIVQPVRRFSAQFLQRTLSSQRIRV